MAKRKAPEKVRLPAAQEKVFIRTLKEWYDIPQNLEIEIVDDEIEAILGKEVVASFLLEDVHFESGSFWIDYKKGHFRKTYFSRIRKHLLDKIKEHTYLESLSHYLELMLSFVRFVTKTPTDFLSPELLEMREIITREHSICCPFCHIHTALLNRNYTLSCPLCQGEYAYPNLPEYLKFIPEVYNLVTIYESTLDICFIDDPDINLYIHALIVCDQLGIKLNFNEYLKSMAKYQHKGFEVKDQDGNVHRFAWYIYNLDEKNIPTDSHYFDNYYLDYVEMFFNNNLHNFFRKNKNSFNPPWTKDFDVIGVNVSHFRLLLKSILYNQKMQPTTIHDYVSLQRQIVFHDNQALKELKFKKLYMFDNFNNHHLPIGFTELTHPFLQYLFGSIDEELYVYDNKTGKLKLASLDQGIVSKALEIIDFKQDVLALQTKVNELSNLMDPSNQYDVLDFYFGFYEFLPDFHDRLMRQISILRMKFAVSRYNDKDEYNMNYFPTGDKEFDDDLDDESIFEVDDDDDEYYDEDDDDDDEYYDEDDD